MKALIIYWDPHQDYIFLNGGAKRWLSSYIFLMEAFGFNTLFVVGKPGIVHGYSIQHEEFETLDEILHAYSTAKAVSMVGSVPEGITADKLKDYTHPEGDVLYIIGGDYSDIEFAVIEDHDPDYVNIDNLVDHKNLWSNTVVGIVLRDRYIKSL